MSLWIRPSVAAKIGIVSASFSIPIAVLLYLVISNINEFIHFGVLEKSGITVLQPLEDILCDLQNHRLLMQSGDDESTKAKIATLRSEVDRAFTKLETLKLRLGNALELNDEGLSHRSREHLRISTLRQQWKQLVDDFPAGASSEKVLLELSVRQARLIADVRGLITHVGDTSNLILDPDLDSYYLMDATLLALPQNQERIARVANYARDVILRGGPTQEERIQLAIYAAMLQEADLDRVTSSAKTSLNEDCNFYGISDSLQAHLPQVLATFESRLSELIECTQQLAKSDVSEMSVDHFIDVGSRAYDASFQLWNVAKEELNQLLDMRIGAYRQRRTWSLMLAGVAVMIASSFAWMATRSIAEPLSVLVQKLGPGAALLRASVELISEINYEQHRRSSESRGITDELNNYAEDMRKTVKELEALVKGVAAKSDKLLAHAVCIDD